MSASEWIRTKLYIRFKRTFIRSRPVCASQILMEPEGILIVLPTREKELATVVKWVKRWIGRNKKTLVVTNFHSSNGGTIYCDKIVPFGKEFYRLKDALSLHNIDLLIDLSEEPQDRSRMICILSKAKLKVASFPDPPFFNCQIRIATESLVHTTEVLRILEEYLVKN